jgi:hypothetical protein
LRLASLILVAGVCSAQFVPPPDGLKGNVYFISPQLRLPDFGRMEPVGVVYTNPLFVLPSESFPGIPNRADWFAIDYTGNIYVREPGKYWFRLVSDDGSKLYVDGNVAIDLDHGLGDWKGEKSVYLSGGIHRIRLSYFQGTLKHHCIALMLSVTPPGAKDFQPFDTRNFNRPIRPEDWKFGSPHDFDKPPDPDAGRVRLKDVVSANRGTPAASIVSLVRSDLGRHASDQTVAKSLDKLIPGERIVPVSSFPPRPPPENENEFLSQLRLNALRYTASLPDFICTQLVRRYVRWAKSHARLRSRRRSHLPRRFRKLPARDLSPATRTEFKWDHWTHLRNRLTQVYSYRTIREHSDRRQETVAGRRGFIYADSETHMVFRITGETECPTYPAISSCCRFAQNSQ